MVRRHVADRAPGLQRGRVADRVQAEHLLHPRAVLPAVEVEREPVAGVRAIGWRRGDRGETPPHA